MDNSKTGAFIKALRTEKGLTQRELGDRLHITDRAVSKWERGLSAPDIALLEPLAEILGVSVVDLIRGERVPEEEYTSVLEEHTREVLVYSDREVRRRENSIRKTAALMAACALAVLAFLVGFVGWQTGAFFLLDNCPSPNGAFRIKIYSKELLFGRFTLKDGISLTEDGKSSILYGDCGYNGLWWSPDSEKFVLSLDYDGVTRLCLGWWTANHESNLNAYLNSAVTASRLADYGLPWQDGGWGNLGVDYAFIQWGPDGDTMLVWYSFTGENDGLEHSGYFWYDCELVCLNGLFELDVERESDFPFSPSAPFW